MNKRRRKLLAKAAEELEAVKVSIECTRDEEQESYDNLPESLQSAGVGESMEENISNLDDIINDLEGIISAIGDI